MFANQADKTAAIETAKTALTAAKTADAANSTADTIKAVEDAQEAVEAAENGPIVAVNAAPDKAAMYLGLKLTDSAAKHNSWGAGLPRGTYSDAKTESGYVQTFGYQVDATGKPLLNADGKVQPIRREDGTAVAAGRYLVNEETQGLYKLYLSMENALSVEQRNLLTDADAGALVFDRVEFELKAEQKDGRNEFKFVM
jgi:hypothetical protein